MRPSAATYRESVPEGRTGPSALVALRIELEPHPLLAAAAFTSRFPQPIGQQATPAWLVATLSLAADAPLRSDDGVRQKVRDLLRRSGFKPTGRSKPASEYLIRAAGDGQLATINPAVDACNVVSLHSGLPISVVDIDQLRGNPRIAVAPPGTSYVFNASGQIIDVSALICLFDDEGPCANAVKDAQRTKTSAATTRTLSIVWGTVELPGRTEQTVQWYQRLVEKLGATVEPCGVC